MELQQKGNIDKAKDGEYIPNVTTTEYLNELFEEDSNDAFRLIIVEGAPGIGKTMVAKEIAYQWAKGSLLKDTDLLLLVYFRDPRLHDIKDFAGLMHFCIQDNETATYCSKYFNNIARGKGLMIVFDGYDELPSNANFNDFFLSLIEGKILPNCKVLFTSRPHVTASLHKYCLCRVEVMGFTENVRHNFLKQHLSADEFTYVMDVFNKHLVIDSLCYIPLNMAVIIDMAKRKAVVPKTQTALTHYSICLTITRERERSTIRTEATCPVISLRDPSIRRLISRLSYFAYVMIERDKFVFSESEIQTAGLVTDQMHNFYGLVQSVELLENNAQMKSYSFVHFSFQEYLAAYYLSLAGILKQIPEIESKFWMPKYFGIWKMYIGITEAKQFTLQKFLSDVNFILAAIRFMLGFEPLGVAEKYTGNKVKCLLLYQILLEAPDNKLRKSVGAVVKDDMINLSGDKLRISDIEIVSHFIARSYVTMNWIVIDLSDCGIDDAGLKSFYQTLVLKDGHKKPTIQCLNLSKNSIYDFSILHELIKLNNVVKLNASCTLSSHVEGILHENYIVNDKLECLDLSFNSLSSADAVKLCRLLVNYEHLKELNLEHNHIDDEARYALVLLIVKLDNFSRLFCNHNCFSIDTMELLEFTVDLHKMKTSTDFVNLDGKINYIRHFIFVMECISELSTEHSALFSSLQSLSLDNPNTHYVAEQQIKLTIRACKSLHTVQPLMKLNLSGIPISVVVANELVAVLTKSVCSLRHLILNNCCLASSCVQVFARALKDVKQMKELQMCDNDHISGEAAEALASAIHGCNSLEILKLSGISIEGRTVDIIADAISNNSSTLQTLKLSGCQLESDAIIKILHNKKFPQWLDISNNHITDSAANLLIATFLHIPKFKVGENKFSKQNTAAFEILRNEITSFCTDDDNCAAALLTILSGMQDISFEDLPSNQNCPFFSITQIKMLCLDMSQYSNQLTLTVGACSSLRYLTNLSELNLSGITIDSTVTVMFADALSTKLCFLKKLVLSCCQLDSSTASSIFPHSRPSVPAAFLSLAEIDISKNAITDTVTYPLVASVHQMPLLRKLIVDGNAFTNRNINGLFTLIQSYSSLHNDLKIYYNDKAMIDDFLTILSCIDSISIDNSCYLTNIAKYCSLILKPCSPDAYSILTYQSSLFLKYFSSLNELSFTGIYIENRSIQIISDALKGNLYTIEKLTLSNCKLESRGISSIVSSLRKDKLNYLGLSHNEIKSDAATSIKDFVTGNNVLQEIDLSNNDLGDTEATIIANGFPSCIYLRLLDLRNNLITCEATDALSFMAYWLFLIQRNQNYVFHLELDGNEITRRDIYIRMRELRRERTMKCVIV